MITRVAEIIHERLGWCPNTRIQRVQTPDTRIEPELTGIPDPESPQPDTTPVGLATPHWMSAAAVMILFATIFVGGNIWWVAFVLAVLILFVILHIRTLQNQGVI